MNSIFLYFKKFHEISTDSQNAISLISTTISVKKNTILQPIGHACKTIYFIKKGLARIYYFKDDLEITESFAFENSIIARAESLFSKNPSRKAIQVLENTELIAIDAIALFKLYDSYPEIERLFRLIFENAYIDTINRIENIQFHTADERYTFLITESSDIIKRVSLKLIASYLGITPVSLSRIRAKN
ncbi:MAG: Crp/Fnr family transcriptional regulator [Flavobacteriia bacterium]|nr:Crp/Fnr family transcriptional regulator [Flavobacteriia bacterium]